MDNSKIKIQADIDLPDAREVNQQIRNLEKDISKLKVSGKFDDSALNKLTKQLNTLKATVTTASFSPTALKELTKQVENALEDIEISNIRIGNLSGSTEKAAQEIGRNLSDTITNNVKNSIDSGLAQPKQTNGGGLVSWLNPNKFSFPSYRRVQQ